LILAGDIGGTSTRLAFFEIVDGRPRAALEKVYRSREHADLDAIVAKFIAEHPLAAEGAAFGIAGPVRDNRVQTPNLAWVVDGRRLASHLGLARVGLINDLEANAWGIAALAEGDLVTLHAGAVNPSGNQAIISAGTGLGEAGLYWDGRAHRPFACEGGHADFAPRTPDEAKLLAHLLGKFERVSYERVVSGPGLANIYDFVCSTAGASGQAARAATLQNGDPSAAISRAALEGRDALAVAALDTFVSLYGAEAGNLALKMMATGGLFVGGGIAPRILDKLKGGGFLDAFFAKGRMRALMESMPVKVILNDKTALLGAARFAAVQAGKL
jgi:glucokinase